MTNIILKFKYRECSNMKDSISKWSNYTTKKDKADDSQIETELSNDINNQGESYAWDISGDISIKEELKANKDLNRAGYFWDMVISFEPDFSKVMGLESKQNYYSLTKNIIPKFLLLNDLKPSEFRWFSVLHTNTEHPHLHLIIFNSNGNKERKNISKENLRKFKSLIANYLLNNSEFYIEKNKVLNDIRSTIKSNQLNIASQRIKFSDSYRKALNYKLLELYKKLSVYGRLQYNSLGMKKNKDDINKIIEYILGHSKLRFKYEKYFYKLQEFKRLTEKVYGKSDNNYVENQINKLFENIGNDILRNYKVYNSQSFIDNEKDFLSQNILNMNFKSGKFKDPKTFIRYAENLYHIATLANLNDDQKIKLFQNWKKKSNYNFDTNLTLKLISEKQYHQFDKSEYLKALRSLGYNFEKYNNFKNNNFYREIKFKNFFDNALKNLMYENEKIDEEILEIKERDLNRIEK